MEKIKHKQISQLVIKLVSLCNLNCKYCYVYNHEDHSYKGQPKYMNPLTYSTLLQKVKEYCERNNPHKIDIAFHGGEPTLVGIDRFRRLLKETHSVLGDNIGSVGIQTNATLINTEWANTLKEFNVSISVSLDGSAEFHDSLRVYHNGKGSHSDAIKGIKTLLRNGFNPTVLCVINPFHNGLEVYKYFRKIGINKMDFLLPDVSHDNKNKFYPGIENFPLHNYLNPILDDWLDEDNPEINIRIFKDLFFRLLESNSSTDAFGNTGCSYLIIESNGDIEINDALKVCKEGLTTTGTNIFNNELDDFIKTPSFPLKVINGNFELAEKCNNCSEKSVCGGGFLPHRFSKRNGFKNPSVWCEDILEVLKRHREYLVPFEE